jgi:hypothetical protein
LVNVIENEEKTSCGKAQVRVWINAGGGGYNFGAFFGIEGSVG